MVPFVLVRPVACVDDTRYPKSGRIANPIVCRSTTRVMAPSASQAAKRRKNTAHSASCGASIRKCASPEGATEACPGIAERLTYAPKSRMLKHLALDHQLLLRALPRGRKAAKSTW